MANDLFGGLGNLGGLVKGLSGFMPQDDPNVKLMKAQSELDDLRKQEKDIYAEIGRAAFAADSSAYPQSEKLKLIQMNIADALQTLSAAKEEQQSAEAAKKEAAERGLCPNCQHSNADGVKFCQECGSPLAAKQKSFCTGCGAELTPGTRFCGECGARQEG